MLLSLGLACLGFAWSWPVARVRWLWARIRPNLYISLIAFSAGFVIFATGLGWNPRGVGAAGDLIRDGETGKVVKQGEAGALSEAISLFLRSPDLARQCGARARAQSEKFTIRRMADAFGQAFDRAAGGGL